MKTKVSLIGLVVNLPESTQIGVVLDATRIRGSLYKATILGEDASLYLVKFILNVPEVDQPVEYTDIIHEFLTSDIINSLTNK